MQQKVLHALNENVSMPNNIQSVIVRVSSGRCVERCMGERASVFSG